MVYLHSFKFEVMNEAAKIVSASIVGADVTSAVVNGKAYAIHPPTIHKLAGAGVYLSEFGSEETLGDVIKSINSSDKLAHALSWLINGDDSLFNELAEGTFDELVEAVSGAYSLVSLENFMKLSTLAKNVSGLIAKQK